MNTDIIRKDLYSVSVKFFDIAKKHNEVQFATECQFALSILENNDYLAKIALENPESLKHAILNVAGAGISLNPVAKHSYLVPRYVNRRMSICLDVSYMGLIHLACATGSIEWVRTGIVYKNDEFTFNGLTEKPDHKQQSFGDKGEMIGVYCYAKTKSGDILCEQPMSIEEINSIRDRSEAWKKKQSGPWLTDYGEMAKKTIVKRASKMWPKVDVHNRLDTAISILNEHEGIDFSSTRPESAKLPDPIDYKKRDEQLQKIKEHLAFLTEGLSAEDKINTLESFCGVSSFKDLSLKNNEDLDTIYMTLDNEIEKAKNDNVDITTKEVPFG